MKYEIETKKIPAVVGMHSLVGVGDGPYPMSFGNYFDFDPGEEASEGLTREERFQLVMNEHYTPRCLNMWAENFREASKRFLDDGLVEVDFFTIYPEAKSYIITHAIVVDERIPRDWLINGPCFTGTHCWSKEMLEKFKDRYNWDHEGRVLEYLNPREYYLKRNQIYEDHGKFYRVNSSPTEEELEQERKEVYGSDYKP